MKGYLLSLSILSQLNSGFLHGKLLDGGGVSPEKIPTQFHSHQLERNPFLPFSTKETLPIITPNSICDSVVDTSKSNTISPEVTNMAIRYRGYIAKGETVRALLEMDNGVLMQVKKRDYLPDRAIRVVAIYSECIVLEQESQEEKVERKNKLVIKLAING